MRGKASFFLGLCLPFFTFVSWQNTLTQQMARALLGKGSLVSPSALAPTPATEKVLSEVTTLETKLDPGTLRDEQEVLAEGAVVYEVSKKRVVFEKDSHKPLQAASTIKIVTAAIALEKGRLDEEIVVNYFPTFVGESSQDLLVGEKFTLEELLYGLLLVSANDASEAITQGLGGKREVFLGWMKDLAKRAGALETNFMTPSGLEEEGHYTTAYDLALLGDYIFNRYPQILTISLTKEKYLPKTVGHRPYLLRNKLQIIDDFPIIGAKAGLGDQGMLSLVALVEKNGRRYIISLIRTPSLKHDLTKIFEAI